jgi:MFS family permease
VSNIGTWMETLALGVFVTTVTGRAEATGGIAALTFLPGIVLSPVSGALADRFDRRTFVATGMFAQTVLAALLTLLAFTGRLTVPAVAVLSLLNGCASSLVNPAFSALISRSVPPEDLHSAFSLNSAQFNLGRIIGPALGAAVLMAHGIAWALAVNTLSFMAVLWALWRINPQPPETLERQVPLKTGLMRGARVAREDSTLGMTLLTTLAVSALVSPFIGLVPVYAIRVFHEGAGATSLLVGSQGLGAVLAAVFIGPLVTHFGRRRLLEACLVFIGPMAAVYWMAPSLHTAALCIVGLGALYMATLTNLNTACQLRVPPSLQGRMSGIYSMMIAVGYAGGVWLQGALADRLGVRLITAGSALLFIALVLTQRLLYPRAFAAVEAPRAGEPLAPAAPAPQLDGGAEF